MILSSAIRLMCSRWLTTTLIIAIAAPYIYGVGMGAPDPYGAWTAFLLDTTPGLALYAALGLNIAMTGIRAAWLKLTHHSIMPETIARMDAHAEIGLHGPDPLGAAVQGLRRAGYRKVDVIGTSAFAQRGKYSFLPGLVLRAGLLILMGAALASTQLRQAEEVVLYEGLHAQALGRELNLKDIENGMPETFIQVGGKSTFRLSEVSARIYSEGRSYTVTGGFPTEANGIYLRITHMGLLQPIIGQALNAAFDWNVLLDVLPPGKTDDETVLSSDVSLSFTLIPASTIANGLVAGKVFELRDPLYRLDLIDASAPEAVPESVNAGPGESTTLGGVDLTLGTAGNYVRVMVVSDPAIWWLYAGLAITMASLVLGLTRLFWYERRACVLRTYDAILIGQTEEFYKKWGIWKFQRLKAGLLPTPAEPEPEDPGRAKK